MISLRTTMKTLRIILALACGFAASQHAVAQTKAPSHAPGTVLLRSRRCLITFSATSGSNAQKQPPSAIWEGLVFDAENFRLRL
jgi:hypothetical protein